MRPDYINVSQKLQKSQSLEVFAHSMKLGRHAIKVFGDHMELGDHSKKLKSRPIWYLEVILRIEGMRTNNFFLILRHILVIILWWSFLGGNFLVVNIDDYFWAGIFIMVYSFGINDCNFFKSFFFFIRYAIYGLEF